MSEPVPPPPAAAPPPVDGGAEPVRSAPEPGEQHFLVQAPLAPMDADGIGLAAAGTVLFALASVLLALFRRSLTEAGHGWWLGVAVCGFGLGLVGLAYCLCRRTTRDRRDPRVG
ncbi:MAG: hypothetical protein JWP61_2611 [Friedmanniella sp.]|nr:hypothetical protein [Friedmanniella sp.]